MWNLSLFLTGRALLHGRNVLTLACGVDIVLIWQQMGIPRIHSGPFTS